MGPNQASVEQASIDRLQQIENYNSPFREQSGWAINIELDTTIHPSIHSFIVQQICTHFARLTSSILSAHQHTHILQNGPEYKIKFH